VSRIGDALRALADAVDAELVQRAAPAPTAEAPTCPWVPIKACGLPEKTARQAVRAGEIASARIGRDVYVKCADVVRFIEARQVERVAVPEGAKNEVDRAIARKRLRLLGGGR
jgi:hypothetical protein